MKEIKSSMIYGDIPPEINRLFIAAMKKAKRPAATKRLSLIVIAAVLLIAIACTAIAVGYKRSAAYGAASEAKQVIFERYGIRPDWMRVFEEMARQDSRGWTVEFTPAKGLNKLGSYTVRLPVEGAPAASWSFDGTNLSALASQGLASDIWGAAQLEEWLQVWDEYVAKYYALRDGTSGRLKQEDLIELDSILLEAGYHPDSALHAEPGEADLPRERAVQLAKEAIWRKYGVPLSALDAYDVEIQFVIGATDSPAQYYIQFMHKHNPSLDRTEGSYDIEMLSPSGNVTRCMLEIDPRYAALPEGELDRYGDAIYEFVQFGGFDQLGDAEKARVSARIIEAGHGRYIDHILYGDPKDAKMEEHEALERAAAAIGEQYGLGDEMLFLFEASAIFAMEDGRGAWIISYELPQTHSLYIYFAEKLGTYRAVISDDTGKALSVSWTNDGLLSGKAVYTRSTWGSAPAWDASLLPWFIPFEKESRALDEAAAAQAHASAEANAALHALFREAGFSREEWNLGLPGENDLSYEKALAIAREVLMAEHSLARAQIEQYYFNSGFFVTDPEKPVWFFFAYSSTPELNKTYQLTLDAGTGEIVSVVVDDQIVNG